MIWQRWSQPVAYFRPLGARVPVSIAEHTDLIRGEAIPRAFARRYGPAAFPPTQQLVLSDRWHLARSIADDWVLWTVRSQRGALAYKNSTSGSPLDFSSTNTFAFDPTSADFLWVLASNDRSGSNTTIDSIAWNANALTLQTALSAAGRRTRMGHRVGSMNGSQNIVVTNSSANTKPMAIAASYSGADQTTPLSGLQTLEANTTDSTWTVASATGDFVCAGAINITDLGAGAFTPGTNTNERLERAFSGVGSGFICDEAGGASITINETHGTALSMGYGFSLKAAAAAGGVTVVRQMIASSMRSGSRPMAAA